MHTVGPKITVTTYFLITGLCFWKFHIFQFSIEIVFRHYAKFRKNCDVDLLIPGFCCFRLKIEVQVPVLELVSIHGSMSPCTLTTMSFGILDIFQNYLLCNINNPIYPEQPVQIFIYAVLLKIWPLLQFFLFWDTYRP